MSKKKREFECVNNQDNFCYICGEYVVMKNQRNFTNLIQENYLQYFRLVAENLDKEWTPSIICLSCHMNLMGWSSDSAERHMKLGVPMIWRKPFCHATDCYFCLSKHTGIGKNMRWQYTNVKSVTFPVPHSDALPIPKCPTSSDLHLSCSLPEEKTTDSEYEPSQESRLLTQPALNDWVRDLELSKEKAELHASRMRQYNFLDPNVKITYYRDRDKPYSKYFMQKGQICFCMDIPGLFKELGQPCDAIEWRLFIDSSKDSLKAVTLNIGNQKPSIPIGHAVNTKETYEAMVELLKLIKYEEHDWKVCSGLKVVLSLTNKYITSLRRIKLWVNYENVVETQITEQQFIS